MVLLLTWDHPANHRSHRVHHRKQVMNTELQDVTEKPKQQEEVMVLKFDCHIVTAHKR